MHFEAWVLALGLVSCSSVWLCDLGREDSGSRPGGFRI